MGHRDQAAEIEFPQLLHQFKHDIYKKARLYAASGKHNGDLLYAVSISACGWRLDDKVVRIAVDLGHRFDICETFTCHCNNRRHS